MTSRLFSAAALTGLIATAFAVPAQEQDQSSASDPSIELPLVGEVPVPAFIGELLGIEAQAQGQQQGQGQQAPPAVVFEVAEQRSVGEVFEFLGRIEPIERVSVQARVPGFIDEVAFQGGQDVAEGDLLFQIDTAQYDAALQSAEAQRAAAQARLENAERSLERDRGLRESGTIAEAVLDESQAAFEQARGTLLQAEAAVRQAQLDLDYTSIAAPIDGRMSEPFETRGNYVSAAEGPLADLIQMDPIWGVFALGENRLIAWQRLGIGQGDTAPIGDDTKATSGETTAEAGSASAGDDTPDISEYDLNLILPDGSPYDAAGSLSFVGNSVDPQTGTVEVRVEFPNPDGLLLPNQNVTLKVTEADPPELPVIPQAAVQLGRDGRAVWVVRDDDTVTRLPIETAAARMPGMVAVTSGLEGGERVITRGSMRLQDGATVDPRRGTGTDGAPGQ